MAEEKKDGTSASAGLKPAQVIASALAAVTAAFLGSTLGVAGTIAGAGIASLVTTVGGELYLRSLRKTREAAQRTKEALTHATDTRLRQETRFAEPPPGRPRNPLVRPPEPHDPYRTQRITPVGADDRTVYLPRSGAGPAATPPPHQPWWKRRWAVISAASVAAFVVGMLAITGFEKLIGHPISGGTGTTFGQVVRPGAPATTTTQQPSTVTRTQSVSPSTMPSSSGQSTSATTTTPSSQTPSSPAPAGTSSAPPSVSTTETAASPTSP
ncbi:hypothetical protein ORV05_36240 [Amycolatopsis cynarae]|uniref:Uncharacterized protein n=1 Tax=Amycolatopsis cynarae TaxID=2995223 RepID=A0ABY7B1Q6_9PSEU|nr:hypothetical protein [Amycolatopsis sp. HUAS 11-8]WAL66227.1 hypothetical protein ORV05_36240 [Amycolatopsis sp. HUAS 11-8]